MSRPSHPRGPYYYPSGSVPAQLPPHIRDAKGRLLTEKTAVKVSASSTLESDGASTFLVVARGALEGPFGAVGASASLTHEGATLDTTEAKIPGTTTGNFSLPFTMVAFVRPPEGTSTVAVSSNTGSVANVTFVVLRITPTLPLPS
jgi:hypothetical protein